MGVYNISIQSHLNTTEDILYSQELAIPDSLASLIPSSLARQYGLFPLEQEGNRLFVAMEDPGNFIAINHIKRITGLEIEPYQVSEAMVKYYIDRLYGNEPVKAALADFNREIRISEPEGGWSDFPSDSVLSAPIVRLVDSLIEQAIEQRASDIHIEPMEETIRIRFRIDGRLKKIMTLPPKTLDPIIARIKILGKMNIAEKRFPQDGRSEAHALGQSIDIRISTMPTVYGEKCVLRLLDRSYFLFPKEALGFSEENLKHFNSFLELDRGILLTTGPTNSGKSTTLYTILDEINNEKDNIITIEDPVECKIAGINQIQINTKGGLTFANSLRSVLRQDPDVIMIGEIRDKETAEMAIRAAITGHLVLSSVHTYDAIGAISRLQDMGIKNYLLADALMGVISQRLIRKVCPDCRQSYSPSEAEIEVLDLSQEDGPWYRNTGCVKCGFSGYKGRTAIHEILLVDKEVRRLILRGATRDEIHEYAIKNGFATLEQTCIGLLRKGITTFEEVAHLLQTFQ